MNGSASDSKFLQQENIANTDVFCALTNNGESNIMMSMLAKRLGAKKVITLITNPAYAELVGQEIDIAISPQQITISSLLTHVRKGDISNVHSLRRGAAEALEITAHGSPKTSKVVGRRLDELDLPSLSRYTNKGAMSACPVSVRFWRTCRMDNSRSKTLPS